MKLSLGRRHQGWEKVPGLSFLSDTTPTSPVPLFFSQILRQFEALCRGQPSPKKPDPSAVAVGSAPCPGDLLTDIPALAGEGILTLLSPAPLPVPPSFCSEEQGLEAETHKQPSAVVPACPCEQEAASRLSGDTLGTPAPSHSLSLFAGMELVARPGTVLCTDSPLEEPRTLSQPQDRQTDTEGSQQLSAFAFLNM